jgi:hypothetical protein
MPHSVVFNVGLPIVGMTMEIGASALDDHGFAPDDGAEPLRPMLASWR